MGLAAKGDLVIGPQLMGLLLPPGRWLLAFGGDVFLGEMCVVLWAKAHGMRARGREERRHRCRHKSSQTGVLVGVTAPLWPRNPLLHVLARSNNPSCLLEAGHLTSSTPFPGGPCITPLFERLRAAPRAHQTQPQAAGSCAGGARGAPGQRQLDSLV